MTDLHEASMGFDLEDLEPFLGEVAAKLEDFGPGDVQTIVEGVGSMAVDEEREWRFSVQREGRRVPLVVRVFLDDFDARDLYLSSDPALAGELQRLMSDFSDRLGK